MYLQGTCSSVFTLCVNQPMCWLWLVKLAESPNPSNQSQHNGQGRVIQYIYYLKTIPLFYSWQTIILKILWSLYQTLSQPHKTSTLVAARSIRMHLWSVNSTQPCSTPGRFVTITSFALAQAERNRSFHTIII